MLCTKEDRKEVEQQQEELRATKEKRCTQTHLANSDIVTVTAFCSDVFHMKNAQK